MNISDNRFVVEADRRVVGIAVRVRGGFKFFSSDPDFQEIEAKTFPRSRAMARRIAEIARARRAAARQGAPTGKAALL